MAQQTTRKRTGVECTECDWSGGMSEIDGNVGCPECGLPALRGVHEYVEQ